MHWLPVDQEEVPRRWGACSTLGDRNLFAVKGDRLLQIFRPRRSHLTDRIGDTSGSKLILRTGFFVF